MEKSRWQLYKEKNGVTPLDLLNPNTKTVSDEKHAARYNICKTCEFFIKSTKQCRQCGCFMKAKTSLDSARCPEGKWH
mgnify:CR=1 FL=1